MNLLFVSNLFPSEDEPIRGLDNATLLPHLLRAGADSIRALALRPTLDPRRWGERSDLRSRAGDSGSSPRFAGVPYIPKVGSRWNDRLLELAVRPALDRMHRESPIDVVLVSWLYPDGCGIGRWCRKRQIPYVMICQGSDAHVYLENRERRERILGAVSRSRGVVTRSRDLADRLAAHGADRQILRPIYNGIDTAIFRPGDKISARTKLGLPTDGKILLFVGNFLEVKNPIFLVEAWREVAATLRCSLVMIGSGPLESEIRAAAGETPGLILPGRMGPTSVAEYMRASDLLCLTSHGEGVPNVVLEAFGCGLPAISTDVGGIREVLDQPFLGRLVPPGDLNRYVRTLSEALTIPSEKERISQHARQFTWEVTATSYIALLNGKS